MLFNCFFYLGPVVLSSRSSGLFSVSVQSGSWLFVASLTSNIPNQRGVCSCHIPNFMVNDDG